MTRSLLVFFLSCPFISLFSNLSYYVDLTNYNGKKLQVELQVAALDNDTLYFCFPAVVPGTYSISDYGRFISKLRAFDADGNALRVKKNNRNFYTIYSFGKLNKLTYEVEDTWSSNVKKNKIFNPGGSLFVNDEVFLMNNGAVFGYFRDYDDVPIHLHFNTPVHLQGFSPLQAPDKNSYFSPGYHPLIASPFLFCRPDTSSFALHGTRFHITVFHESGKQMAENLRPDLMQCMEAVYSFCGFFPVDDYTFIFHFRDLSLPYSDIMENPRLFKLLKHFGNLQIGALEHKNASVYTLVDLGDSIISPLFQQINFNSFLHEVAIHEFLHTITPIGLHSNEIGQFDFNNTKMSKHLWLYEGAIDYMSNLAMLQHGMVDLEFFLNEKIAGNIKYSQRFPFQNMSLTELSKNVLEKRYNKYFQHIYTLGANTCFLLDLEMINKSVGQTALNDIILPLHRHYGFDTSFDDNEFPDEFFSHAPASAREFYDNYIEGRGRPEFNQYTTGFGITYHLSDSLPMPTLLHRNNGISGFKKVGNFHFRISGELQVAGASAGSVFKSGDIINIYEIESKCLRGKKLLVNQDDTIYIHVKRKGEVISLPFIIEVKNKKAENFFRYTEKPQGQEAVLRDKWLGRYRDEEY